MPPARESKAARKRSAGKTVVTGELVTGLDVNGEGSEADARFGEADVRAAKVRQGNGRALSRRASGDGSELVRYDPLEAYMQELNRYQLLTPEQERTLALRYAETGDLDAAAQLVTANLRLVVKIAYEYRRTYRNLMDLIQEGNIGLMHAVRKFDPHKGVKLSTYSAWWIRAYMLRFILNNWRLVKIGTTQAQRKLFFNLQKEKARLSAMGIEPTAERLAAKLDVTTDEVVSMDRRLASGELSLDAPLGNGDDGSHTTRIELLEGNLEAQDEFIAGEETRERFHTAVERFGATLKGKEAVVFRERLLADNPKTLQELGDSFGVSRERVRQIETRIQQKLREYVTEEYGATAFES